MNYIIKYDESIHRLKTNCENLDEMVDSLTRPLSVILQITRNCHFNCEFCSEKDSIPDPPLEDFQLYSRHLSDVPRVFLSGGEPLTRPDFKEIVNIFKDGHILGLPTNAVATENNLETISVIKFKHRCGGGT